MSYSDHLLHDDTYQRIAPLRAPLIQHKKPIYYYPPGTYSSDSYTPDPRAEEGEPCRAAGEGAADLHLRVQTRESSGAGRAADAETGALESVGDERRRCLRGRMRRRQSSSHL